MADGLSRWDRSTVSQHLIADERLVLVEKGQDMKTLLYSIKTLQGQNCFRRLATSSWNRKFVSHGSKTSVNPEETKPKKNGLLYRMAPPKGGTEPPDAKFLAVALVVLSAGYYAWFIDPPKKKAQQEGETA